MSLLKPEAKLAASQWFFDMLLDVGRAQAQDWVACHYARIGKHSTVDLADLLHYTIYTAR